MIVQHFLLTLIFVLLLSEIIGNPLKFPEGSNEGRSLETPFDVDSEARFHHHRKKKKFNKFGCGHGHGHKRFKRQTKPEGRFFFPILNYYDTDIIVSNGYGDGGGCGSTGEIDKPSLGGFGGKPPIGGLGVGFGNIGSGIGNLGSGLGSGIGNIGSGLGSLSSGLSNGLGGLLPSIGNGISPFGGSQPVRPPPVVSRPPVTRPPLTRPPTVSPPQTTTDGDGDSEDYDYSDFSTTVRSRPIPSFTGHRPVPITNPLGNIKPVFERPERYFNQYIVKPINRTIREFYSLF